MGKVKNLEKKAKVATEFDKKSPGDRVKSIKDEKPPKKAKIAKKSEGITKAKNNLEAAKKDDNKKKKTAKKVKIITAIKQEVEAKAKTIATDGIKEDAEKLVAREIVKKALIAVKDGIQRESEQSTSKNLFDDEMLIGMTIVATKVPNCPPHTRKITLAHSLFAEQPDICFFIRDAKPKKGDQEENIREFQKKLYQVGVKCKKVMTVTQLKQDYNTHNLKLKLCNLYDVFLVESEIAEHVYSLLGKTFIVKRKRPLQVDMQSGDTLKISIEKAMKKVNFKVNGNSKLSCFEVGTIKMDNVAIADNVMTAIEQLKEKWPGGWKNISRLFLKPMRQSRVSIPIFYSNINPNEVSVPVIKGNKASRLEKLASELDKKSQKLKLDLKSKTLVKVQGETKPSADKAYQSQDNEKDKKRKQDDGSATAVAISEEPTKKKSKKTSESIDVIPLSTEPEKKDKKKSKKKEQQKEAEPVVPKEQPPAVAKTAEVDSPKKKKKKGKAKLDAINAAAEEPIVNEQHELEKPAKKNKKKKSKNAAAVATTTDTIQQDDSAGKEEKSEKEQVSKMQKKKKEKKNKA